MDWKPWPLVVGLISSKNFCYVYHKIKRQLYLPQTDEGVRVCRKFQGFEFESPTLENCMMHFLRDAIEFYSLIFLNLIGFVSI